MLRDRSVPPGDRGTHRAIMAVMTAKERFLAGLSRGGPHETCVGVCYENIFIRDHWPELTRLPWWYSVSPDLEQQIAWRREVVASVPHDWLLMPVSPPREEREALSLEVRPGGVLRRDRRTGEERLIEPAPVGGGAPKIIHPDRIVSSREEIEALVPPPEPFDAGAFRAEGRADLADRLRAEFPLAFYRFVTPPTSCTYDLWGFEGMMTMLLDRPDLVRHASGRFLARNIASVRLAAELGCSFIWVEEAFMDSAGPDAYRELAVPHTRRLLDEIRSLGMRSIFYFGGDCSGKLEDILSAGPDAVALEEGKKGFVHDIEAVAEQVDGRCALVGNLDAINVLPSADNTALAAEVARQARAGRRNRGRFIFGLGSPVTPATPAARVRRFCELCRET